MFLTTVLATVVFTSCATAQDAAFARAVSAFQAGDYTAARKHVEESIKTNPRSEEARLLHGMVCLQLRDYTAAIESFNAVLKTSPNSLSALDRRGDAHLKLGRFKEAVADFDRVLELQPDLAPEHWRRGIALYYAGRHADGVKQFETHRTANPEDVENAVWHYLCNVKVVGPEKARANLIAVTKDRRVPMAEIQKLFAGQLKPADVLARAEREPEKTAAGTEARFYAHLYVALWHEAAGEPELVRKHLAAAVEKYRIGHYMWDVARAHLDLLRKSK
jgi:lipoprotein NlpI